MISASRGLAAIGVFGTMALAPSVVPAFWSRAPASFDLECGRGGEGVPGVVAIHLLDQGGLPHGKLILASRLFDSRGLDSAHLGSIRIESNAEGSQTMCESTPPGHFNVHGPAKFLNGTTLRVFSSNPVRVEIQDSTGKVLAFRGADPALHLTATIAW